MQPATPLQPATPPPATLHPASLQPATGTNSDLQFYAHAAAVGVLSAMMLALLALTFQNDEHLAHIFHSWGFAWALFTHASILLLPPLVAILPAGLERAIARGIWLLALLIALGGNIAGSVAHAAGVPMRSVLDGWPVISEGAALAAIAGGVLLVASEGALGLLWERAIVRLALATMQRQAQQRATLQVAAPMLQVQNIAPQRKTRRVLQWQRPAPRPALQAPASDNSEVQPARPPLQFPARPLQDDVQPATPEVADDVQPEQQAPAHDPAPLLPWETVEDPAEDAPQYICPNAGCGRTFERYQQRSAHMRYCEFAPNPALNGHSK